MRSSPPVFLSVFCLLQVVSCRLSENDKAFLLSYLGDDFTSLVTPSDVRVGPVVESKGVLSSLAGPVDFHEHDHTYKEKHHHKAKGGGQGRVTVIIDKTDESSIFSIPMINISLPLL